MSRWACGIRGCGAAFDAAADAVVHQAAEHEPHECEVCGAVVPEGYFAIRHAFDEHTRAEFVRAYGADADDIRERERVKVAVEAEVDVEALAARVDAEP